MKKSDVEKRLNVELKACAPSDFESVWKQCESKSDVVTVTERVAVAAGSGANGTLGGVKRNLSVILAVVAAFALIAVVILKIFIPAPDVPSPFSGGVMVIDVNPSVEIDYDKDGKVTDISGLNTDGKALLVGVDAIGKSCDDAVKILVGRCIKLGYFSYSRQDNAMLVSATDSSGADDSAMSDKIKTALKSEFADRNLRAVVINGLNDTEFGEKAKEFNISAQKYALIQDYVALGGTLDESEYSAISVSELYKKINAIVETEKAKQIISLGEELKNIKSELYDEMLDSVEDIIDGVNERLNRIDLESAEYEYYESLLEEWEDRLDSAHDLEIVGDVVANLVISSVKAEITALIAVETDETLKSVLLTAISEINALTSKVDGVIAKIELSGATAERLNEIRAEIFGDGDGVGDEFDYDEWFEKTVGDYELDWYGCKRAWQQDRINELK